MCPASATRALALLPGLLSFVEVLNFRVMCTKRGHSENGRTDGSRRAKGQKMPRNRQNVLNRRTFLIHAGVLGAGVAVGAVAKGSVSLNAPALAATPGAPDATATRVAELDELHALQTQVATDLVCTPAATATPEPTATQVPAVQAGTPISYQGLWTIAALGIAPLPVSNDPRPSGKFMQVTLEVSHSASSIQLIPYTDFLLVDSAGRFANVDQGVNRAYLGNAWLQGVEVGVKEIRSLIFDVAADAGDSFVLESQADPTFRVALTVEARG